MFIVKYAQAVEKKDAAFQLYVKIIKTECIAKAI